MGLRDYIPTLTKPESGYYIIHERRGKVAHEGEGISFWYINALDNYTLISTNPNDLEFCVDQASQEWQGVEVKGIASWRITNPKKAKNLLDVYGNKIDTQRVSDRLSAMITSEIRYQVANTSIEDAMRQRGALLKEFEEKELLEISEKWGINIDAFKVTDVRVKSLIVFQDLQRKYREKIRLEAEKSKMQTDDKISQESLENKKRETQRQYELDTEKRQYGKRTKQNELETIAELERIEVENKSEIDNYKSEKEFEYGKYLQKLEFRLTKLKKKYENSILAIDKDRYKVEGEVQELKSDLEKRATDVEVECKKRLAEIEELRVGIANKEDGKIALYRTLVEVAKELKDLNIDRLYFDPDLLRGFSDNIKDYIEQLKKPQSEDDMHNAGCAVKKPNPPNRGSGSVALNEPKSSEQE